MRILFVCGVLALALSATPAFPQGGGIGLSLAAVGDFPSGDFEKRAGVGYGGLGGVQVGGENITVTARSGYLTHLERSNGTWSFIPLFGGLTIASSDRSVYVAGELGPVLTKVDYSGSGFPTPDVKETNLGWSVGVGSCIDPFDFRFSFSVWDTGHIKQSMSIGLSLGLLVWAF